MTFSCCFSQKTFLAHRSAKEGYVPLLRTNLENYFLTHCLPMGSTQTFYETKYQTKVVSITSRCWRLDSVASKLSHFVISKCSLFDEPSNWFEYKGQQKSWDILFRDGQMDFLHSMQFHTLDKINSTAVLKIFLNCQK